MLEQPSGSAGRRTALSQYLQQLKADMDQYNFERYTAPELDNVKWQVMQVRVIRLRRAPPTPMLASALPAGTHCPMP